MKIYALIPPWARALVRQRRTHAALATPEAREIVESGLFDVDWYLSRYPHVGHRGYPPLVHYLRLGARQMFSPNAWFDGEWYAAQHPEVARGKVNPIVHYLAAAGTVPPSPGFDAAWYRTANADIGNCDPLAHFLKVGEREGRAPREPLRGFRVADRKPLGGAWRIAIKVPAPDKDRETWGDYHFAEGLRAAFVRLGHFAVLDFRDGWHARPPAADDLVVVIRGQRTYEPHPAHFNVLWNISHPETILPGEFDRYDLVYRASTKAARHSNGLPVRQLLQATDTSRFSLVSPDANRRGRIVFVGNSRRMYRDIVRWTIDAGMEPEIYGKDWHPFVPRRLIKARNVDNRSLASIYGHALVVLNDHWQTMRDGGFISNRVFDVVASGGALVSDRVPGMAELLGEVVVEVDGPKDIPEAIARSAAVPREHRVRAARMVADHHSFDARAQRIVEDVSAVAGTSDWKQRRPPGQARYPRTQ